MSEHEENYGLVFEDEEVEDEEGSALRLDQLESEESNIERNMGVRFSRIRGSITTPIEASDYEISSDESLVEDIRVGSFVLQKKLPVVPDFFEVLGMPPSLDEISLDSSMKREMKIAMDAATSEEGGEEEELVVVESKKSSEEEPKVSEAIEEDAVSSSSTEISEYKFEVSSEEEEEPPQEEYEHLFEALVEEDTKKIVVVEEFDYGAWSRQEAERQLRKDTAKFLERLINFAVERAEFIDPREIIRENLDKEKAFEKIFVEINEIRKEKSVSNFLMRKCVEYFRRLKTLRVFTPEPPEQLEEEKKKYENIKARLDCLLGDEKRGKEIIEDRIDFFENEEEDGREALNREITSLENFIRKVFSKRGSDSFASFVEKRLKEMARLRKEVSSVRVVLISHQHVMARLNEKAAAMENLGEGLKLTDYENMDNERIALEKKLEERTSDLQKTRARFNADTHMLAHIREKQTMMYHTVFIEQELLNEYESQKESLRKRINELKIDRIRVKHELQKVSMDHGLIDKPILLIEFDNTVSRIADLKVTLEQLRQTSTKLEYRLKRVESRNNRNAHISHASQYSYPSQLSQVSRLSQSTHIGKLNLPKKTM